MKCTLSEQTKQTEVHKDPKRDHNIFEEKR